MTPATKATQKPLLLRWSEHVPCSDIQDPLGLSLRGASRLASRLLHCITSITPRARYFSFLLWCFHDYQSREKNRPDALGIRKGVILRENALTLACAKHHQHHKGGTCQGGALVGTIEAKRWLRRGNTEADLKTLKFAKIPALNAYFTSLVNLGCFVTAGETTYSDEESEEARFSWEDIELSPLGLDLARRYDQVTGALAVVQGLATGDRRCGVDVLADLGQYGGLCELTCPDAADRPLLRDIFFGLVELPGDSHPVRRQSLLLILELCRLFGAEQWMLNEGGFASAVYYGELSNGKERLKVEMPATLQDIETRWRMFYFHQYMGVALEGMFSWIVTNLDPHGLGGASVDDLVARLDDPSSRKDISDLFGTDLPRPFGAMTPREFFDLFGVPRADLGPELGTAFNLVVSTGHPVAEDTLEGHIRGGAFLQSSTGLALPMILLATTLARYGLWERTKYGQWLATAAPDPYLDLVPPVLSAGLSRRFGDWWGRTWRELTEAVLTRYVVRQHQSMAYEKSASGDRCLLQTDDQKVFATGCYEKIGLGNPRLRSAIQILKDLALIETTEDDVTILTEAGKAFLAQELAREVGK